MIKVDKNKSKILPQHPACKLSILVPSYNESTSTIKRLLESISLQRGISRDDYEVLLVVNNDSPLVTPLDAYVTNQDVLNQDWADIYKNSVNISVFDHSTMNYSITSCNIGAVRDLALTYAYLRFKGNSYNGIVMHVDADVYLEDKYLLSKYVRLFCDRDVIGVIGGKWREVFTSDFPNYSHEYVKQVFEIIGLSKQCKELSNFINGKPVLGAFGGSNMLARCFESVNIGGFKHINLEEDKEFGYRLSRYAQDNNCKILNERMNLKVVASLRISDRTGSSITKDVETLLAGGRLYVKHPPTPGDVLPVNMKTYELLVNQAMSLPGGVDLVRYIEDYGRLWIKVGSEFRGRRVKDPSQHRGSSL